MTDIFYTGGLLFMSILTLVLISTGATACYIYVRRRKNESHPSVTLLIEIGVFGLVLGTFAQFLGLYEAFRAIEQIGSISPTLLIGGLRVSSIPTIYGLFIFILALLLYFGLKATDRRRSEAN